VLPTLPVVFCYSINRLFFGIEIPCAHNELRSELFYNMGMNYSLFPREVSGGYLLVFVVVARFQGLTDPCGIWGRQRGNGTGFSPSTLVSVCI